MKYGPYCSFVSTCIIPLVILSITSGIWFEFVSGSGSGSGCGSGSGSGSGYGYGSGSGSGYG